MLSGCDRVKPAVYGCSSGIRVSANLIVVGESLVLFFAVRPGGPAVLTLMAASVSRTSTRTATSARIL